MSSEIENRNEENRREKPNLRPVTPHSILRKNIDVLRTRLTGNVDNHTMDLADQCHALIYSLDEYIEKSTTGPSDALVRLEKRTNEIDWDGAFAKSDTEIPLEREMLSGSVEGQFLRMIVAISKAERVLEIGSFTGYASLAMAEALPSHGTLIALELDSFTARFAEQQILGTSQADKINIMVGDAMESLRSLKENGEPFDLVFIDADKTGYLRYYNFLMDEGLVPIEGLICVDNTLLMGEAYRTYPNSDNGKAIQTFNEHVSKDPRVEQVLLPLRDGVTLIRRIG